jgi:hypothetical protein
VPPISSIAIRAPASEPGPLWSAKLPAMSLRTPMVTDAGSDCACAATWVQASMQAAEMTTTLLVMTLSVA